MASPYTLGIEGLRKRYGAFQLEVPEFTAAAGETVGVVGNNGAGKTTLFRTILDLIKPDEGAVSHNGEVAHESEEWKRCTGSYLDQDFLIPFLTPREHYLFVGQAYGIDPDDVIGRAEACEPFLPEGFLEDGKFNREYSEGNKQRIGIVAALVVQPRLLVLDEPFANLDPTSQIQLSGIIRDLTESRSCITLISSHNIEHVAALCPRIALMEDGRIIRDEATNPETLESLRGYFMGEE